MNLKIESVEGFSGHSDRNQLLSFVRRISPKPSKIVVGHGERHKVDSFAHAASRMFKVRTIAPDLLETIRSEATVDEHTLDQILPYMALAGKGSRLLAEEMTGHAETNVWAIERFLGKKFSITRNEKVVEVATI